MRLVKAAKASPHAKFYNLSTGDSYAKDQLLSKLHAKQIQLPVI